MEIKSKMRFNERNKQTNKQTENWKIICTKSQMKCNELVKNQKQN